VRPLTVENARLEEPFASLAATTDLNIGSYIGVPIILSDGTLFGTLCAIDPDARIFSRADTDLLTILSRMLAFQIDRDQWAERESQLRHEAQLAVRQTEAILDATRDAMVFVTPDAVLRRVNRPFTEFFGVAAEEVEGQTFMVLRERFTALCKDPQAFLDVVEDTAYDPVSNITVLLEQSRPVERWLQLVSNPVLAEPDRVLGRLYVFRDVTLEQRASQMKTQVLSEVAHELRTPLTAIRGHLGLLLDPKLQPIPAAQLQKSLTSARNAADRMNTLIGDMLDLSRIEAGHVDLDLRVIDLNDVVRRVMDEIHEAYDRRGQHLNLFLNPGPVLVRADSARLGQIIANLGSNASKYTPEGGTVTVSTAADDACVVLKVADTGIGMSPEDQAQLFTKFVRSHDPAVRRVQGTGLGLAVTRALVEAQQGTITFESELGKGTTFYVTFPRAS
jgi:PAS domain S-box-containing protein